MLLNNHRGELQLNEAVQFSGNKKINISGNKHLSNRNNQNVSKTFGSKGKKMKEKTEKYGSRIKVIDMIPFNLDESYTCPYCGKKFEGQGIANHVLATKNEQK